MKLTSSDNVAVRAATVVALALFAGAGCAASLPEPRATNDLPPAVEPATGGTTVCQDADPAALAGFQASLDAYGAWTHDSTYGLLWIPAAEVGGEEFRPFVTGGHWELTEGGEWFWASDSTWGDVTTHYGRWVETPQQGWGWIPGACYADAWATWRTGPYGYIGWAPVAPVWGWWRGVGVRFPHVVTPTYTYTPTDQIFSPVLQHAAVPPQGLGNAAARTRPYVPAHPHLQPDESHFRSAPSGPTLVAASIPPDVVPAHRVPESLRVSPWTRAVATLQAPRDRHLDGIARVSNAESPYPSWRPISRQSITLGSGGEPTYFGPPRTWGTVFSNAPAPPVNPAYHPVYYGSGWVGVTPPVGAYAGHGGYGGHPAYGGYGAFGGYYGTPASYGGYSHFASAYPGPSAASSYASPGAPARSVGTSGSAWGGGGRPGGGSRWR